MPRWLRQATLTVVVSISPVLLLEGGLRLAGWPTQRVRTIGKLLNLDPEAWDAAIGVFRPGAHSTVMWPPELSYAVQINRLGLRGPEIEPTPPEGRTRMLALGDSMTFGYYLEENETWPARLEALLRARGRDVEVVNGASGGWSITSQASFLEERALALEPDHVMIGFCANDIADLRRGSAVYDGQKNAVGHGKGAVAKTIYASAIYELFVRYKVAWKHLRERWTGEVDPLSSVDVPEDQAEALWARYAEELDRIHAALRERDIPLTLVYLPDVYKLAHDLPATDEVRLRQLSADRGLGFVSPLADFESRPNEELFHLPLDHHLAPDGAARVAAALDAYFAGSGGEGGGS